MPTKINGFIHWTPRVLSILFLLFLAMFSLDVIEPGRGIGEIAIGLFMHNIPVFVLLILLVIAWKHEIVGAVVFILAGLLYIVSIIVSGMMNSFEWYMLSWPLTISGPAFLVGGLFLAEWIQKKKLKKQL